MQANGYRDDRATLMELGTEVVGISGDTMEGLALFKRANDLNFPLLSDADGAIARTFGVPLKEARKSITRTVGEEEFTLTREVTAKRWTFVIDKEGKIVHKDTQVKAALDSKHTVEVVKQLQEGE